MFKKVLTFILPWKLKRQLLNYWFGYSIHPTARIGLSWIYPTYLEMHENSRIDHLTVAINLDRVILSEEATIGRGNWITGFPTDTSSLHFKHQSDRKAELFLGAYASITKNHHIDCTNLIKIGKFSTIAGYRSQLLTHSINIYDSRQDSSPIIIGDYTFVGTNVVILGGAVLPNNSVLGAKSLFNQAFENEWCLYGGVPAKEIKQIDKEAKYFHRENGFVF